MKRILAALCIAVATALPASCLASGFGWHAFIVKWDELQDLKKREIENAYEVMGEQRKNAALQLHFQQLIDNRIITQFCANTADSYEVTPRLQEHFSTAFIEWGTAYQRKRGVQKSIFELFKSPPLFVQVSSDAKYARRRDLWFVVEPSMIQAYQRELNALNMTTDVPYEFRGLSKYMEAVLLLAANDHYQRENVALNFGLTMQSAVFFCGYD